MKRIVFILFVFLQVSDLYSQTCTNCATPYPVRWKDETHGWRVKIQFIVPGTALTMDPDANGMFRLCVNNPTMVLASDHTNRKTCDRYVEVRGITNPNLYWRQGLPHRNMPGVPFPFSECGLYKITYIYHLANFWNKCGRNSVHKHVEAWVCIQPQPVAPVVTSSGGSNVFCINNGNQLNAFVPGSGFNWRWEVRASGSSSWNTISGATSSSYIPKLNDAATSVRDYRVTAFYPGNTYCAPKYSSVYTADFQTMPPVSISGGPPVFCEGYPAQLSSSITSGYTYKWFVRTNLTTVNQVPGQTSSTLQPTGTGSYFLNIYNPYGCISKSNEIDITVLPITKISFTGLKPFYCPSDGTSTLEGNLAGGVFSGPGISGSVFDPVAAGGGTHTITYSGPNHPGCPTTTTNITAVMPKSPLVDRVISATAITYSDAWPLDFSNSEKKEFFGANSFENGTKGIWRGEEAFTYVDERKQQVAVKIKEDGTVDNLVMFNYSSALNAACYPNWRRLNTITQYSPYSFETENKDILDIYSSALFGYRGDLTTAVAANARFNEIAFDGFEEYIPGQQINPSNVNTGNLTIYTSEPSATDYTNATFEDIEVEAARNNELTILMPYAEAGILLNKVIKVYGAEFINYTLKNIHGTFTVTAVAADADPEKANITLSPSEFYHTGVWKGKISIPNTLDGSNLPKVIVGSNVSVSDTKAHTGKNSLRISGQVEVEQVKLGLIPGKKYVLSCWVSTDDADTYTFKSSETASLKRGVTFRFLSKDGTVLGTSDLLEPSGDVIEGWQRIEQEFLIPAETERVVMLLATESGVPTYYDDLRIFPFLSNIQTYVYHKNNYKLSAVLDNNNYASLYYYDEEGNLFLVKKETERGIQTIQESFSHIKETH